MISLPTTTAGSNAPAPKGSAPAPSGTTGEFESMIAQIGLTRSERTGPTSVQSEAHSSSNRSQTDDEKGQSASEGRPSSSGQPDDLINEAHDEAAEGTQPAERTSVGTVRSSPADLASDEADPADFRLIAQFLLRAAPAAAAGTGSPHPASPVAPGNAGRAKAAATIGSAQRIVPAPTSPSTRPSPQHSTSPEPELRPTPASTPVSATALQKQAGMPALPPAGDITTLPVPGSKQSLDGKPVLWGESERPIPARMAATRPEPALLGSVEVTRRETHFAPVRRSAAIDASAWRETLGKDTAEISRSEGSKPSFSAVADQLGRALEAARPEAEARLQQSMGQQTAAIARSVAPLRIVELSLQPASLGNLVVTMRLSGSGLRISVSTSTRETADILREDRKALKSLIEDAGYEADEILVTYRPSLATT